MTALNSHQGKRQLEWILKPLGRYDNLRMPLFNGFDTDAAVYYWNPETWDISRLLYDSNADSIYLDIPVWFVPISAKLRPSERSEYLLNIINPLTRKMENELGPFTPDPEWHLRCNQAYILSQHSNGGQNIGLYIVLKQ